MKAILLGASFLVAAVAGQEARAQSDREIRLPVVGRFAQIRTGDYTVPAGTTTAGSVTIFRGDLDVYGNVDGAATAVGGDVVVHEGARVRGGAVAIGGHVRNEGGSILGVIKDIGPTHNRQTVSFGGRPRTTLGSLVSALLWLVVLLIVGTFVLFFMRDYLTRTVEVITNETGRSLFTGVLSGLLSIPALIAVVIGLTVTIIGIFFIPIGVGIYLFALFSIGILGFLAVAHVTGIAIAGKRNAETPAGQELQFLYSGVLAFSALWIIAAAFTWFPILGSILRMLAFSVTFVAVLTGFGAVILSWWRQRPKKNAVAV